MRLRQGSLFARSVRATGSSPEGAAYRKGAGGRRGIGRKGKLQAAPAGAGMPGHTGIIPEFHPNHGEAESGTRTGLGINRDGTIFRTSN